MRELKPCEKPVYLHFMLGGPLDGQVHGAMQRFIAMRMRETSHVPGSAATLVNVDYKANDEEPEEIDASEIAMAIPCSDEYVEPVYFRINMEYQK